MWCVYINRTRPESRFSFSDLLNLQEQVLSEMLPEGRQALLFAEVTPTVTLGSRQVHEASTPVLGLEKQAAEVVHGQRGGNETWHGPGQWVGFVISPLQTFTGDSKGVRKAVYLILEKVLAAVRHYRPEAHLEEGDRLGIWSSTGKLVSVGIKIKKGYITSGFAVNCIQRPESFLGIAPCGIAGAKADFLFKQSVNNSTIQVESEREFERFPKILLANW